jgi:hypothetical protein
MGRHCYRWQRTAAVGSRGAQAGTKRLICTTKAVQRSNLPRAIAPGHDQPCRHHRRGDVPTRNSPMMLGSIYASSRANRAVLHRSVGFHGETSCHLGGTVVELISHEGIVVDPAPQTEHLGYRMIALEVDDMEKTADYLRTKGVDIV